MGERCDGEAGTQPCAGNPFLHLASSFPPSSPALSSILIAPQLAKSEPPSCEGLSPFFSQPPERQQAASKSVSRVTSVEEAVRAGEEPARRRLPRLAACQGRNVIHSREAGEHPPAAGCLPCRESSQSKALLEPPRTDAGVSLARPLSFIWLLGWSPVPICRWGSELNLTVCLHFIMLGLL